MDIDVRPCSSTEELRDALNAISHYFGHENQLEDAERFAKWIEVDQAHGAARLEWHGEARAILRK